jgi:DNA polymerase (family 10)
LAAGEAKATVLLKTGKQVDIYAFDPGGYGSLLQYFTGSKQHNIHLRKVANSMGYSLSEHGIRKFKRGKIVGKPTPVASEEEFYRILGMPWIPPEIREDGGEIEAALARRLPDLVELGDIKGDTHTHTTNSDGEGTAEEMVEAAIARGLKYYGISDHAPSVKSLGVKGAREVLLRWKREVEGLRKKYKGKIEIFFSGEIDITAAAEVELPDGLMAIYDYTTASIHSSFNQPKEQMTKRIINALKNPYVNVIGHPTGRLLGKREAYEVDWDRVFDVAVNEGKFLEINAFPTRLDLPDTLVRAAKRKGAKFVINTDAHHSSHLDNMRFGVAVARRGWCEKTDIINALDAKSFAKVMKIGRR